jgi:hypothetical protein
MPIRTPTHACARGIIGVIPSKVSTAKVQIDFLISFSSRAPPLQDGIAHIKYRIKRKALMRKPSDAQGKVTNGGRRKGRREERKIGKRPLAERASDEHIACASG